MPLAFTPLADPANIAAYAAAVELHPSSPRHRHAAAAVLSSATYRDLAAQDPADAIARLTRFTTTADVAADATFADMFDQALMQLVQDYRNEYVFKNAIVSKIVFGRHRPTTASAVLELPLGGSFADVAVFNGTSTVYEVKTDLDSFARLRSQVRDYETRVEFVNLVVSDRRSATAARQLPDRVGLIALNRRGTLRVVRKAQSNRPWMRSDHIFDTLRQAEAECVVEANGIHLGSLNPIEHWNALRDAFANLPVSAAHTDAVEALRRRGQSVTGLVSDVRLPRSMRALAYAAPLSRTATQRLISRLTLPASLLRGT